MWVSDYYLCDVFRTKCLLAFYHVYYLLVNNVDDITQSGKTFTYLLTFDRIKISIIILHILRHGVFAY